MTQQGQLPEQVACELKAVLRIGTRPSQLAAQLPKLPALTTLCANGVPADQRYEVGRRVSVAIADTVDLLGEGPYGIAAGSLLGIRSSTRGLPLSARRREAAAELGVTVATLIRHRETPLLLDLATELCARRDDNIA